MPSWPDWISQGQTWERTKQGQEDEGPWYCGQDVGQAQVQLVWLKQCDPISVQGCGEGCKAKQQTQSNLHAGLDQSALLP